MGLGGDRDVEYRHNLIIEIASELGLVGVALWSIAFLASIYATKHSGILLVLIIQTFIAALFSGDLGYNYEYLLVTFAAFATMPSRERATEAKEGGFYEQNRLSYYRV